MFGLPDERMGEVPAAVFRVKNGRDAVSPGELREFLLSRIAPFKVPLEEHIWVADDVLPRLGTQKIDKKGLREAYTRQYASA